MTARLYSKTGPLAGSTFEIDDEATIGRSEENDIVLPSDDIADVHARVVFDDDAERYMLEDLDTEGGTRLDDAEVVEPMPLDHLHILTFGQSLDFIFQVVAEDAVAASSADTGETQFGVAPESPSDLPGKDEASGEQTQLGGAPGSLPDFSEDEPDAGDREEDDEAQTQFGDAPPELPDLSDEEDSGEDPNQTKMGPAAPGTLPDLSEEEETSAADEEVPDDAQTQFGDAPPELPDLSKEEASDADQTQVGGAPGAPPDRPDTDAPSEDDETAGDDDQTQFGAAPPDMPDLSDDAPSDADEPTDDAQTQIGGPAPDLPGSPDDRSKSTDGGGDGSPFSVQVVTESGPQKTYSLSQGESTIGRSPDCDVQIEDPGVSREHAKLTVEGDEVVLEDMGSKNFTFVDGDRLSGPTELSPGSEIQFGLQVKAVLQRTSS